MTTIANSEKIWSLCLFLVFFLMAVILCKNYATGEDKPIAPSQTLRYEEDQSFELSAPPYAIAWSPDGAKLAVLESPDIIVFDARTWQRIATIHALDRLYSGKSLLFGLDDSIIVGNPGTSASSQGKSSYAISIFKFDTGNVYRLPSAGMSDINGYTPQDNFAASRDLKTLVSWNMEGNIFRYDLTSLSLEQIVYSQPIDNPFKEIMERFAFAPKTIYNKYEQAVLNLKLRIIAACSLLGTVAMISFTESHPIKVTQVLPPGSRCTSLDQDDAERFFEISGIYNSSNKVQDPIQFEHSAPDAGQRGRMEILSAEDLTSVASWSDQNDVIRRAIWIPKKNYIVVAGDKGDTLLKFDEQKYQLQEQQHFGLGSFLLSASGAGQLASVKGTKLTIYKNRSGEN